MGPRDFDDILKTAIRERRLAAFVLDEATELAEPRDCGMIVTGTLVRNTGRALLRTLNFDVPPAYDADGDELSPAKR